MEKNGTKNDQDTVTKNSYYRARKHWSELELIEGTMGRTFADDELRSYINKLLKINPKILYAPKGGDVDEVIKKMNESMTLLAAGEELASEVLGFATDLKKILLSDAIFSEFLDLLNARVEKKTSHHLFQECVNSSSKVECINHRIELMQAAACTCLDAFYGSNLDFFKGFSNERELVDYFLNNATRENITVIASLIFNLTDSGTFPPHIVYKIRQNVSMTPTTYAARTLFRYPGPRDYDDTYYKFGFLFIQDLVERSIIDVVTGSAINEPGTYIHEEPFPCFIHDRFLENVESIFPLILAVSWVYTVAIMVQSVVYEKERKLEEMMYVMGVGRNTLWFSWFLTEFLTMSFTMGLLTLLLWQGGLLPLSDPVLIFLFLEEFAVATILMGLLISSLYSRAKIATACAGIIYFLAYLPSLFIAIREQSTQTLVPFGLKLISSLSTTSAFGMAVKSLVYYEWMGSGCNFENFYVSPINEETFSVAWAMGVMVVDCIFYAILAVYFDKIFTSHGPRCRWYFPLSFLYRFCLHINRKTKDDCCSANMVSSQPPGETSIETSVEKYFFKKHDRASEGIEIAISLDNISKSFGHHTVISNLSLNMYKDQVTAILGHNGAGKSTTMNIIIGSCTPTSGSVVIEGRKIANKQDVLESSLGTCPQHNVLFDNLTVREHLYFYAKLKSDWNNDELVKEVDTMLLDLQLCGKRDELVNTLSGGMKRRLSVAIAFIGGSNSVILDEPTAGVDPFARRAIWDIITKYKKGRSIMIATHLMDEADVLADRIAIMSEGSITAIGSPLFLKKFYGDGYYLTFVLSNSSKNDVAENRSFMIAQFCGNYGPLPTLFSSSLNEESFRLKGWKDLQMIELFKALEVSENLNKLGITSYGLRESTLEEIFFKLGTSRNLHTLAEKPEAGRDSNLNKPVTYSLQLLEPRIFPYRFIYQFIAVIYKRYWCFSRNWKSLVSQLLLPAVFVAGGMAIALPAIIMEAFPPLKMSTFQYANISSKQPNTVYFTNEANSADITLNKHFISSSSLIKSLYSVSGIGADCLIANSSLAYLDANLIENRKYLDELVTYDLLIDDCRQRSNFCGEEKFLLRSFLMPSYVGPKNTAGPKFSTYPQCECVYHGTGQVCYGGKDSTRYKRLITGDNLYDLTNVNLTRYIISTASNFDTRYGGLSFGFEKSVVPNNFGSDASSLRVIAVRHLSKVWYNNRALHSMPVFLNVHNNALLRASIARNKNVSRFNPSAFGITLINHPMEGSNEVISMTKVMESNDVLIAVFLVVGMSFVPASFVYFLVYERTSLALHLQTMAGLSHITYWFANILWDLTSYCLPAALCTVIIKLFGIPLYNRYENFLGVTVLLLLYGAATTPSVYLLSFAFDDPSNAYIATVILNLFIGVSTVFTSFLLQLFGLNNVTIASLENVIQNIFLIFPGFCLGSGVMEIAFNDYYNQYYEFIGETGKISSPFSWDNLYPKILAMCSVGFASFILTLLIDCITSYNFRYMSLPVEKPLCHLAGENEDVSAERFRVLCGEADGDIVKIDSLSKLYKKRARHGGSKIMLAVDDLCLGVPEGQCFGLLGVNGAGKTTLFNILTGTVFPNCGSVSICSCNISQSPDILSKIGYCPQFDALYDELTVREHFYYYCRIRGYSYQSFRALIEDILIRLDLASYSDSYVGTLSGGTKRKLSTSLALIGSPKVIILDEPTTGMDPSARRFLQGLITNLAQVGRSILFSSHSMEECENLCERLSIMVNGRLKCLGSCQHLKNVYGNGYSIRLRFKKDRPIEAKESATAYLLSRVPNALLKESHLLYAHFEAADVKLSNLFVICSELCRHESFGVECYSISQNNLDDVFVSFVREQCESGERSVTQLPM